MNPDGAYRTSAGRRHRRAKVCKAIERREGSSGTCAPFECAFDWGQKWIMRSSTVKGIGIHSPIPLKRETSGTGSRSGRTASHAIQTSALFGLSLTLACCTHVAVKPIDAAKHQIASVCIKENSKVQVVDFLAVVQEEFLNHGIETDVYTGDLPENCQYRLNYTARRSWDIVTFLSYAELRLMYGTTTIGVANYRHSGGFALNKWASTKSKMTPVIDKLLQNF